MKKQKYIHPYGKINWEKIAKLFQHNDHLSGKTKFPQVKEVLHILAAVGAVGIIFAFPGATLAVGALIEGEDSYSRWGMRKVITRLKKQKYVTIKQNHDGTATVKITKNGLLRALTYHLDSMKIDRPKKWDKKWRVIIFDIPEKYKRVRDVFRFRIIQLGLYKFQESVYIFPYPCFDQVEFLRELYGVSFKVKYLLVEQIEEDQYLKSYFKLDQ